MGKEFKSNLACETPLPAFHVQIIKLRQPDGSLVVKAGRVEMLEPEVSVSEFHRETGVSTRHIQTLCEQGFIKHRRLTPKKNSKILIPRSELERFKTLQDDPGHVQLANSTNGPSRDAAKSSNGHFKTTQ